LFFVGFVLFDDDRKLCQQRKVLNRREIGCGNKYGLFVF
jgi:hypothetical protein